MPSVEVENVTVFLEVRVNQAQYVVLLANGVLNGVRNMLWDNANKWHWYSTANLGMYVQVVHTILTVLGANGWDTGDVTECEGDHDCVLSLVALPYSPHAL
jgi:hypothetical protein